MEENSNKFNTAGSFKYLVPGVILFILIVVAGGFLYQKDSPLHKNSSKNSDFGTLKVIPADANAFGSLASANVTSPEMSGTFSTSAPVSKGVAFGMGGGGTSAVSDKMIAPGFPIQANLYTYKYVGEDFELPDANLDVLRRVKGTLQNNNAGDALKSYDFGSINLNSFDNTNLDNFSVTQNSEFGYVINVSFVEDSISIYQNWQKWVSPACIQTGCSQPPLQIGDLPEDSVILDIAKNFVQDHAINTSTYGEPFVMNNFRVIYYASAPTIQKDMYIPDQVQVMYPLVINDKSVYDASGNKTGLSLSVDVRNKKVSGLWQLTSHTYQSSAYPAETDVTKIKSLAEKGGMYGGAYYYDSGQKNARVTTLELEKPTIEWMVYWMPDPSNNNQNEVYVPALVFPIKDAPADLYQKNVIVPLIKDVLDANSSPTKPMPYEGAAGEGQASPPIK